MVDWGTTRSGFAARIRELTEAYCKGLFTPATALIAARVRLGDMAAARPEYASSRLHVDAAAALEEWERAAGEGAADAACLRTLGLLARNCDFLSEAPLKRPPRD